VHVFAVQAKTPVVFGIAPFAMLSHSYFPVHVYPVLATGVQETPAAVVAEQVFAWICAATTGGPACSRKALAGVLKSQVFAVQVPGVIWPSLHTVFVQV
jgi:hypothetical protein